MAEQEADIVTIVSSELIASVMEEYFNKKMYRQNCQVSIVDLRPTEAGYSFFLVFKPTAAAKETPYNKIVNAVQESVKQTKDNNNGTKARDTKGHFVKAN